ncbi:MAG: hypothetical protein FWF85_07595, partial [Clostridiales bacterium]|nr:hypothetical protein [Clostridiales bacterium]
KKGTGQVCFGETPPKNTIKKIIVKTLNKEAAPFFDVLGPGKESHPEDWNRMIKELEKKGVEIKYKENAYAYCPSFKKGKPGQLHLDPNASISALEHEYTHFVQFEKRGFPSYRDTLKDTALVIKLEEEAYAVEIQRAKALGLDNVVQQLEKNLSDRIKSLSVDWSN